MSKISYVVLFNDVILLTLGMTWIYNNTNSSILAVMIYHLFANLAIFPTTTGLAGLFYIVFAILIMVFILVIFGPRTLVRGSRNLTEES